MALSNDLISQFVKTTKDTTKKSKESSVYGRIVVQNGVNYVILDGSNILTPVMTTAEVKTNERVLVTIKNHSAIVTGNTSSPAARIGTVNDLNDEVVSLKSVTTEYLETSKATIGELQADSIKVNQDLEAKAAKIEALEAENVAIKGTVTANKAEIDDLSANKLSADDANITFATIDSLKATDAEIDTLKSTYGDFVVLTSGKLGVIEGYIEDLQSNKISATDIESKYANIDFSFIGKATMEYLYAQSGLIKDVKIGDATITGNLVGVTISGDRIQGNTIIADKLVIMGEDGLYYKLNTDGVKITSEDIEEYVKTTSDDIVYYYQDGDDTKYFCECIVVEDGEETTTYYQVIVDGKIYLKTENVLDNKPDNSHVMVDQNEYNSLNGSVIQAKSITATQINVRDLVAFDATIGGFKITNNSIYSGFKESVHNAARGVYLDSDGQVNIGDSSNYIKYHKDSDDAATLEISARTLKLGANGKNVEKEIDDRLNNYIEEYVRTVSDDIVYYYQDDNDVNYFCECIVDKDGEETTVYYQVTVDDNEYVKSENVLDNKPDNSQALIKDVTVITPSDIKDSTDYISESRTSMDALNAKLSEAKTQIEMLTEAISMLVVDEEGSATILDQTGTEWTFNFYNTIADLTKALSKIEEANGSIDDIKGQIDRLNSSMSDYDGNIRPYIQFKLADDDRSPRIELGILNDETNRFKVLITNKEISFMKDNTKMAYINDDALNIDTAIIDDEFKIGNLVWSTRNNGNIGLVWKG
ncbi:MAG: hypothetical protein NC215_00165 [Ruminococcus sp.]|nr:hypothetical protein [Ruminococcus sp.]